MGDEQSANEKKIKIGIAGVELHLPRTPLIEAIAEGVEGAKEDGRVLTADAKGTFGEAKDAAVAGAQQAWKDAAPAREKLGGFLNKLADKIKPKQP